MERSERVRSNSMRRGILDSNLPTLKSSVLVNKAMVAISKVDINILKDQRAIRTTNVRDHDHDHERPMRTTSNAHDKDHPRSQSGFAMRKNKDESGREGREGRQFDLPHSSSFKLQLRDVREELESQSTIQPLLIDKSKISSKPYGIIRGYSANSHSGPVLSYNEDRICIVTNLTKSNPKQRQVSFFGVYDGHAGVAKADFLRDNFHLMLLEDLSFSADLEVALRRTLQRVAVAFAEDGRLAGDESSVSFVIVVVANEEIYYLQSGGCRSVVSQQLGANIFYPSRSETALLTREPARKARSVADTTRTRRRDPGEVELRRFGANEGLDFILLGRGEGVFENLRVKEIGRRLWLYLLGHSAESIHFALGEANNLLLADVFASPSSKNASIIIIAFDGATSCLHRDDHLRLPYLTDP